MPLLQATGPGNAKIVAAAKEAWDAAKGQPYKWGGHDVDGFDCSGFVCYVLRASYNELGFTYLSAADLFIDSRFSTDTSTPQFGDLIGFKKGADTPHDHVGIVFDTLHWISSQTSTGVAPVLFSNFFWSSKKFFFLRPRWA